MTLLFLQIVRVYNDVDFPCKLGETGKMQLSNDANPTSPPCPPPRIRVNAFRVS